MAQVAVPAWLIYTAVAASAVSAGVGAYSAYSSGQQQKKAGEYNAEVAESEAVAANQKAEYESELSRKKFKTMLGQQALAYSDAGVDLSSGSPLLMMALQAEEGQREQQEIKYTGSTYAGRALNQGYLSRMQGRQAGTAGKIGAGATFLSGLANAGSSYYMMKK